MADELDVSNYQFHKIIKINEFPTGERIFIEIGNSAIVVFNVDDRYYAIADKCSHDGGQIGDGELEGCEIVCPRHGARFDIINGKVLTGPAFIDIPVFPTRVTGEWVEVGLPD